MSWTIEDAPATLKPAQASGRGAGWVIEDAPDPTGSFAQNALSAAGKAMVDTARGAGQALRSALPERAADALRLPTQADIDEARTLDEPLMRTAGGKVGNFAGQVAMTLPALAVPGANTYAGSTALGSLLGFVQPTAADESRALNTGIGAAGGAAGKWIGDKLAAWVPSLLAKKEAAGAAQQSANAVKDTTLATSRAEGYVVPPTQANPSSSWNHLLEGVAGKVRTAQGASVKNQEVTNRLAKEALGLPADQPLTAQALKAIRDRAGQAYEDIASAGQFVTDATFKKQVTALSDAQRTLAKEIPELADDQVLNLAASLNRDSFDGRTLIEINKALREKATAAYKEGATDAGRFYKGAAREIEDLIERNLMYTGKGGAQALKSFQDARQIIAKSHTVEGALNDATGNVSAPMLAAQLKKGRLSGELKTAAEFAHSFPKAAQSPEKTGGALGLSPLDYLASLGMAVGDMGAMSIANLAARPAARSVVLSGPYQRAMTSPEYGPGASMRLLARMAGDENVRRLAPMAGASGALQVRE